MANHNMPRRTHSNKQSDFEANTCTDVAGDKRWPKMRLVLVSPLMVDKVAIF